MNGIIPCIGYQKMAENHHSPVWDYLEIFIDIANMKNMWDL